MIGMNRLKSDLGILFLMLLIELKPPLLLKIESLSDNIRILTPRLLLKHLPLLPINAINRFLLRVRKFHFKPNIILSIKQQTPLIIAKTSSLLIRLGLLLVKTMELDFYFHFLEGFFALDLVEDFTGGC